MFTALSLAAAAVVITATRIDTPAFDVPASVDRIDGESLRAGRAQINLSEGLGGVPGLLARDRQNHAQDTQISVRGFGARSTFGIRGVRLYVDGIPATLPDGQGQISHVELGSVGRIEVLRGPFSALYGNAAGGVIQVFSEDPGEQPRLVVGVAAGSDQLRRVSLLASGREGRFGYTLGASAFDTDGYRDHSQTQRRMGNAKLGWRVGADTEVTLVANSVALPQAQDPLGLTRAQFDANPRGVDPAALTFDTRKQVNQTQGGVIVEHRLNVTHALRLMVYQGHRGTEQFQSIPVATQGAPLHPGGVIALARDYRGVDLRWTFKTRAFDAPLSLVGGVTFDDLDEIRRGHQNFIGSTLGVRGALRRDERNAVSSVDAYLQTGWRPAPAWTVNAGVRRSSVRFRSNDHYIVGSNPDDSGRADYAATLPVIGVMFAAGERLHLYATAGRGFETPTLNELAYRTGGSSGLNLGLRPARSTSVEVGIKARPTGLGELSLALFRTGTEQEIVTLSNVGGRATFQNAGRTRRSGVELAWSLALPGDWRMQLALSGLDAVYRDAFSTCTVTPCTVPNQLIAAGNRLPGLARKTAYGSLLWSPSSGWRAGIEARATGRVEANDANTESAAGFGAVAAYLGYQTGLGPWEVGSYVRVDNLLDRRHAGSLIVNEGNGRFFEPAPGRSALLSMSATLKF